nr:hypothetical protein [Tanacetum cinerariifolium]
KPKRKNTQVPQPSGLTESVAYESVHKELGDSLVWAATTASSLEAEQDNGNIDKTQSKVTPNESSSQETNSGGGPRCQETMGDTIAQTRFESLSKHSNDLLLVRGNTLQSDEDSLKLNELMELCTNLQNRVLDLEKTKITQRNKIDSLKKRVKKLEKRNRSRTHKLKRLYKVGLNARVKSSRDEESLGEDASKQGRRIDTIGADEDITLVNNADNEMFDVDALGCEEVFVAGKNEKVVEKIVDDAQVSTDVTTVTTKEIIMAQALEALKTSEPKAKIIIKSDLYEEATLKLQAEFDEEERLIRKRAKKEQEANISLIETWDDIQAKNDRKEESTLQLKEHKRKGTNHQHKLKVRKIMCNYLKNMKGYKLKDLKLKKFDYIQGMFDRAFRRVNTFEDYRKKLVEGKEKRAGEELEHEILKKQKVEDDKEKAELKQLMETILDEEVAIDAIPLVVKSPRIVDWKIHKEGKKSYYQIVRVDGKSRMYMFFSQMLKSFDREDLKDLYKLVKARYRLTRLVENMDYLLWSDMKLMFEPHVEDEVWKRQQGYKVLEWKLYDSCGVHSLIMQSMQIYMMIEKKYPLAPPTLSMMLEKNIQIDYESERTYQLFKLIKK